MHRLLLVSTPYPAFVPEWQVGFTLGGNPNGMI